MACATSGPAISLWAPDAPSPWRMKALAWIARHLGTSLVLLLMLAEEGPLRFAAAGMQNAAWEASRPHD